LAAETRQNLFVENRRRRARQAFVDNQPHRVRTDVDDRDRRPVIETALEGTCGCRGRFDRARALTRLG
jgi:hypothetical protein